MDKGSLLVFLLLVVVHTALFTPIDSSSLSLIASSTEKSNANIDKKPKIYKLEITSSIANRYSQTTVISKVKNVANASQETTFFITLPDTAFITGFTMEINAKNYTALIKEGEEAYKIYKQALESGLGAAHVTTRDSNLFTVSANIESEAKATFYLTYEEFLKRKNGKYEQIINIYPRQIVEDIGVTVKISENRKIINLKTPPIRSGNEIENDNLELDPRANIEMVNETTAIVRFSPNLEKQKQIAHILGTDKEEGFAGQFIVQYDVERDPTGGEILTQDGYFVHFFSPSELTHIPRHVIFVLDTSQSMEGQKIEQLKNAMLKILNDLHEEDLFSLVVFGNYVQILDIENSNSSVIYPSIAKRISGYCFSALTDIHYDNLQNYKLPMAYLANKKNIRKAQEFIQTLVAYGGTDILSALSVGLQLAKLQNQQMSNKFSPRPIMILLSDGAPTIRELYIETITNKITNLNLHKTLIFTLSFGDEADRKFLQKLAVDNSGFSKHIYEAGDASLQLQDFYQQISSPILFNLEFKYIPEIRSDPATHTETNFPVYFDGSELVVVGRSGLKELQESKVNGWGIQGNISLEPSIYHLSSNIERLWAYLTIKQLLEKEENLYTEDVRKKVIDLALKYSFVTPVTSLIVVKPNDSYVYGDTVRTVSMTTQSPNIVHTTPYCRELYITTTEKPSLFTSLPWINDVLSANGIIKLPNGEYKLGVNETITENVECPKTPFGSPGKCRLLNSCSTIFSHLTNANDFVKHSCVLKNEFIGVCCPETMTSFV